MGIIINPFVFGGAVAPEVLDLLLDNIPYASGAFALRKLDKNYTGSCIKVRRSNDDALADIGFDSNGDLDTTALLAHTSSNNGFVHTWYDQSGLGYNATQTTNGSQPRIVNSGTVEVLNTKPSIYFSGSEEFDIDIPALDSMVGLVVASQEASSNASPTIGGTNVSGNSPYITLNWTDNKFYTKGGSGKYTVTSGTYTDTNQHLTAAVETAAGANITQWRDGEVISSSSVSTTTSTEFERIGRHGSTLQRGYLQEIIYYDEDRYIELTRLMSNVGAKYRGWSDYSLFSTEFDGVADYVDITDSGTVSTDFQGMGNNNAYSFFCWIKSNGGGNGAGQYWFPNDQIVGLRMQSTSSQAPFAFGIASNVLWLGRTLNQLVSDEAVAGVSTVNDNAWHHVGFTVDGNAYVLYVDGSSDASGTFSVAIGDCSVGTNTSNFQFGCRSRDGGEKDRNLFDGNIDEAAFWNTALTSDNVTTIYNEGVPADLTDLSPTAWWRMGDESGAPYLTNKMAFSKYSTEFDGIDDYVTMGNVLDEDGTGAFSISFWEKLDSTGNTHLVGKMLDVAPYSGYAAYINSNKLRFAIINSFSANTLLVDTTTSLSSGTWQHIVITYDGSQDVSGVTIYINGVADSLTTIYNSLSSSSTTTADFTIAARNGAAIFTDGKIDEVSFFNSELSAANVTTIYNSGTPNDISGLNPVAYYKMGEGAIFPKIPNETAYSKQSLDFDGVDDYVAATVGEINGISALSISFWCKRATASSTVSMSDYTNDNYGVWFFWTGGIIYWACKAGDGADYASYSLTGDTNWHHVVGTYSGSGNTIKLYIDDSLVATRTGAPASLASDIGDAFLIGKITTNYTDGNIDEVAIFSSELSAANVTTLYNDGAPNDISALSPISWWKMGDGDYFPTMTDSGSGSNNGTATNMSGADVELDTPNGWGTSTNMTAADIEAETAKGNHGIMTNMGQEAIVQDAPKYSNLSIDFDGINQAVTLGNVLDQDNTDAFSVSAWIKLSTTSGWPAIVAKMRTDNPADNNGWNLSKNSSHKLYFGLKGSAEMKAYSTDSLDADVWYHVVGTYDGSGSNSGIEVYINGSLATGTQSGTLSGNITNTAPFVIGARNTSGNMPFPGNIDEAAFFDSELTLENVRAIYNNGRPTDISSLNPVGWWRMGELSTYPTIIDDGSGSNNGTMTNMTAGDIENETP